MLYSVNETAMSRNMIRAFNGYNHNLVIDDADFYDEENITTDLYPVSSPRKKRKKALVSALPRKILLNLECEQVYQGTTGTTYGYFPKYAVGYGTTKILFDMSDTSHHLSVTVRYYDMHKNNVGIQTFENSNFAISDNTVTLSLTFDSSKVCYIDILASDDAAFDGDVGTNWRMEYTPIYRMRFLQTFIVDGKILYIFDNNAVYDGKLHIFPSESLDAGPNYLKQYIVYGSYIVGPYGYFNLNDVTDLGIIDINALLAAKIVPIDETFNEATDSYDIKYTVCDSAGSALAATVSATAPTNPSDGDYWLDTTTTGGLKRWSASYSMWTSVATSYVKIQLDAFHLDSDSIHDWTREINSGDAIKITHSAIELFKNYFIVTGKGTTDYSNNGYTVSNPYIIAQGILDTTVVTQHIGNLTRGEKFNDKRPFVVRDIPKMQYVCVSNNRIWGCGFNEREESFDSAYQDDLKATNEIYACKLGDFKNWHCYAGASTDSYTLSLGDNSTFTGAITYNDYPYFFKENKIYMVYGAYPAAYQLKQIDCRGVEKGSANCLCVVGNYLYYKSAIDICLFDGNTATSISDRLGTDKYTGAIAGCSNNKLYVSMVLNDERHLFIYDTVKGMWNKETGSFSSFTFDNCGRLLATSGAYLYSLGENIEDTLFGGFVEEGETEWSATTGLIGLDTPDHKYISKLNFRMDVPVGSVVAISIEYDSNGTFTELKNIDGDGFGLKSYIVPLLSTRCDHLRIKLTGTGDFKLYSITKTYEEGSDD